MSGTYVSPESIVERVKLLTLQLPLVLQRVRVVAVAELIECVWVLSQRFRVCGKRIVVENRADVGHGVWRPDVVTGPHGVKKA